MRIAPAALALFSAALAAAAPTATLTLTPESPEAGASAILRIEVESSSRVSPPRIIPLANLTIVAGPSVENRFQWINGQSSSSTAFVYQLQAGKSGAASIGPVSFPDGGGGTFEAPRLDVSVEKASAPSGITADARPVRDPFLIAKVEPESPRAGQQAVWTIYLLTRGKASGAEMKSLPDFRGFWTEELDSEPNPAPKVMTIGGIPWRAFALARKAIFPTRAGKLTIGAATAVVQVRGDIFDIFGDTPFGATQTVERVSAPLPVTAAEVPAASAGLPVGSFTLKSSLDRTRVPDGASAVLTVTMSGDGRLAELAPPAIAIDGASVSDPESHLAIKRGGGRWSCTRTWQWVVVPSRGGTIAIPPIVERTADPSTGKLVALETSPLSIVAEVRPPSAPVEPPREAPQTAGRVNPERSPGSAAPTPARPAVPAAAGAAAAALLLLAGFWLGRRHHVRAAEPDRRHEASPERSLEAALSKLSAGARSDDERRDVDSLAREFDAVRFAPQLSARDEALHALDARVRTLAKRRRVRL